MFNKLCSPLASIQGFALSSYLSTLAIDEDYTYSGYIPWCILFVDDTVLIDETGRDLKH